jgi:hypothetical protein
MLDFFLIIFATKKISFKKECMRNMYMCMYPKLKWIMVKQGE